MTGGALQAKLIDKVQQQVAVQYIAPAGNIHSGRKELDRYQVSYKFTRNRIRRDHDTVGVVRNLGRMNFGRVCNVGW